MTTTPALALADTVERLSPEAAALLRNMQAELNRLPELEAAIVERCAVEAWMTGMVCR